MLLVTPLLALALSTEIHVHLTQKESDEGGHDYQFRGRLQCPVRGNSTLYSPEYKILPASGDFRDIRTSNWAYCAALCAITTEPTRCAYWAWNFNLQGDPDVGPPGTCILHTYQQLGSTHNAYRGIIHGSSRCRPGNDFHAICETYEPVWPTQCQRDADCAGSRRCNSVAPNLTRARVECVGDRCSHRNLCQNQPGVPVGCGVLGCVSRNGSLTGNPSGIIMQDCAPPEGTTAAIRRETAKCPFKSHLSYGQCADLCSRHLGCEHFTWYYKETPISTQLRCRDAVFLDRTCFPLPTRKCFLHDSGKGYSPPPANLAEGERWITGNYQCAGTPEAPHTVRLRWAGVQGTRLTPILGTGNKWTNQ